MKQENHTVPYQTTLNAYLQQAVTSNWQLPAFTDFRGETFTFGDVATRIARLHKLFSDAGLKPGDKMALCGRNSSRWSICALAALTYGAVAVPILNDFKPDVIHHLVNHSRARLLFADSHTISQLDRTNMPALAGIVRIDNFTPEPDSSEAVLEAASGLDTSFAALYPHGYSAADVKYATVSPQDVVLINYTSGSTGFSKGVMLSEQALWSNAQFCIDGLSFLLPGDTMLSMLPLAHMFGFMIEMVHPFIKGCHITFLGRTPSPKIFMEALAQVQPKLIITVPLILEKVIKTRIFPLLRTRKMRLLTMNPLVRRFIYNKIKKQLISAFGGRLREIIVGGAAIDKDVAEFLRKIRFPFTVGYGMTECGPLISYTPSGKTRPGSCGQCADRMEVRVDSPDPQNTPGVLWVRGDNVMNGYFHNPEATEACMGTDGWMSTGDIGVVDADGFIYLRGRDKNMILGPSGQNIYPEEIEQVLNNLPYVMESIVVDNDEGKLVALIHPDYDAAEKAGVSGDEAIDTQMKENIAELNRQMPAYSKVSDFKIYKEEFEKTPKRSIKRYLYMKK